MIEIQFPVIADDTGRVAGLLGLIHPGKGTENELIKHFGISQKIRNVGGSLKGVNPLQGVTAGRYEQAQDCGAPEGRESLWRS